MNKNNNKSLLGYYILTQKEVMKIYILKIRLRYFSDIPHMITAWSGSFSLKIVYDYYQRIGIDFEKKARKPFIVEPLIHNEKYILTGIYIKNGKGEFEKISNPFVMKNQDIFQLKITFTDYDAAQKFMEAFLKESSLKEPAGIFIPDSISIEEKELPIIEFTDSNKWSEFKFRIRFLTPTNFIFHGHEIPFPSPFRLLYNISKDYYEFTKKNYKEKIEKLMLNGLEIEDSTIKKVFVDIGEGRKVPCFIGSANYIACTKEGYLKAFITLFEWAEFLGVGKSKSLGFGRIKLEF